MPEEQLEHDLAEQEGRDPIMLHFKQRKDREGREMQQATLRAQQAAAAHTEAAAARALAAGAGAGGVASAAFRLASAAFRYL